MFRKHYLGQFALTLTVANFSFAQQSHNSQNEELLSRQKVCPSALAKKISTDDKSQPLFWWLFNNSRNAKSTSELCKSIRGNLPDNKKLEEDLFKSPLTQLSSDKSVADCLDQLAKENSGFDTKSDGRAVIAEYNYSSNRLSRWYRANLETIASIDKIYGNNSFKHTAKNDIKQPKLDSSDSWISQLSDACGSRPEKISVPGLKYLETPQFAEMYRGVQEAYNAYWILEDNIKKYEPKVRGGGGVHGGGQWLEWPQPESESRKNHAELKRRQELLVNNTPYLRGEFFSKILKRSPTGKEAPSPNDIAAALRNDLMKQKKSLLEQLPKIAADQACLDGKSTDPNCITKMRNNLSLAPKPPFSENDDFVDAKIKQLDAESDPKAKAKLEKEIVSLIEASGAMTDAECRSKIGTLQSNVKDAQNDFLINSAITVGTMGLGSIVAGSRLAVAAGRATTLSRGAHIARAAIVGLDGFYAYSDIKSVVDSCGNTVPQPDLSGFKENNGSIRQKLSCGNGANQDIEYVSQYKSCLTQGLIAGLTAVPVLAGNMAAFKKVVPPKELLLGTGKVTKEQADDIVKKIQSHSNSNQAAKIPSWQLDAQKEEAFKLAANLLEQGLYKPGSPSAAAFENSIAKLQDIFPGASRWTGAPRLNSKTAVEYFKDFSKSGDKNSIDGFNEVLDSTLKKLNSKHGQNYTKAQALDALGETIRDYKHLSAKEQSDLLSCVRNLVSE